MAKQYFDAAVIDSRDDMSQVDGTALTLVKGVRLLYDDTINKSDLIALIDRIRDKIIEVEG